MTSERQQERGPRPLSAKRVGAWTAGIALAIGAMAIGDAGGVNASTDTIELEITALPPIEITLDGDIVSGPIGGEIVAQCMPAGELAWCSGSPDIEGPEIVVGGVWANAFEPEWQSALGWIVDEAIESFPALYGVPDDARIAEYGRAEIRAYMQQRLLEIVDKEAFGIDLNVAERRALDFVVAKLVKEDLVLAEATWAEYERFNNFPCAYGTPAAPAVVDSPVRLPSDVVDRCENAQSVLAQAFEFAPPMPTVDHFKAWGAYAVEIDRGLSNAQQLELASQFANAMQAGVLIWGIGVAAGAAAVTAALVGTSFAVSYAVAGLIGSVGVLKGSAVVTAGVAATAVGAAVAATVIGIIIFAAVVIAVAIWQLIEREKVGQTLKAELDQARSQVDPLDFAALQAANAGKAFREGYDVDLPLHHGEVFGARLVKLIVEGDAIDSLGRVVTAPQGVWAPNVTGVDDHRFRVLSANPTEIVDSINIAQAEGPDLDVRFDQGWMIVSEDELPGRAALSFTYTDLNGDLVEVMRAPESDDFPNGGFVVIPLEGSPLGDPYITRSLQYNDGAANIEVELALPGTLTPGALYPAAIGAMTTKRSISLRPNPVNEFGQFDLAAFQTGYDFEWTVDYFDAGTQTWAEVHTDSTYGTTFVPATVGRYRASVTMVESVTSPQPAVSGSVSFEVAPPEILIDTLELVDNGFDGAYVDLQLGSNVLSDKFDVTVTWPGDIGSDVRPQTVASVSCSGFAGPHMCNTLVNGVTTDELDFEYGPLADLGQGVDVTISNEDGGEVSRSLEFANIERPTFVAPTPSEEAAALGEFDPRQSYLQQVVGDTSGQVFARVQPGAWDTFEPSLGLYDPVNDSYGSAMSVIGNDLLQVSLVEDDSTGEWVLTLKGPAGFEDMGTYEIPIVVQQTDTGGTARATHVLYLDVVPAADDQFRAVLANDIPASGGFVSPVPALAPMIMGGKTGETYDGEMCVRLLRAADPPPWPELCQPAHQFFQSDGSLLRFPYAEAYALGLRANSIYRARTWLTDDTKADVTPHEVSFMVATQRPTASLSWDDSSSTLTLVAVPGDPGARPVVGFTCRLDGAPTSECFDSASASLELVLSSGEHTFEVVVVDDEDNYTTDSLTFEVAPPPTTTTTTTLPPTTTTTTTLPPTTTTTTTTTLSPTTTTTTTTTLPPTTTTTTTPPPSSTTSTSVLPATTTATTPSGQPQVVPSGPLLPGVVVDFLVKLTGIKKGNFYRGILRSTPVNIPATMATEDGQITFLNVTLPDDWEPGAHTLTVYDDVTDEELAVLTLQDDGQAQTADTVPITPVSGNLPETGGSGLGLLQRGLIVLLMGAFLVLLARRRQRPLTTQ